MALLDSDLILVGRGGDSFRTTAQDLKTFIESGDGLVYRGTANLTISPVINPNPPVTGDLYVNTTAGTVNVGWVGAAGSACDAGDRILWDGAAWSLVTSSTDVGVTDVSVVAPIVDTGTPASPVIGVSDATNATKGVVVLSNVVADVATTAATPKAINDYSVPLDLSTLMEFV